MPKTKLGMLVQSGQIVNIDDIFTQGLKIREPSIVDSLIPDLKQEVLGIGLIQKQTDAGEKSRFKAVVAVGNEAGFIGVGTGKAMQVRSAIDKATFQAKLNIIPVRRGCGSWECRCNMPHSLPFKVRGRCGSVRYVIIPGPRGLGLVGGEIPRTILSLAGIADCWTRSFGSTSTLSSTALATFDALRNSHKMIVQEDWSR